MLNSKKDYRPRISPSEITQISFSLMPTPILSQTIKTGPKNEKMQKKYRKKWKYFSRILLRRFTVYFSKELYRVSLPVIQLRNYYIKRKFQRWIFRFKWSKMAHKIHRIYYIKLINERRLNYKEKKIGKLTSNQLKWRTIYRLLMTSETRSKLYLERNLLIKERRMMLISKWKELYIKIRPKNLQNIQQSFIEKRHIKYIYRKYFIRWILKCRNQEDSIGYIFKVEYPEVFLNVHLNMNFDFGPYSTPFSQQYISQNISILKDVYDFNEMLYSNELENLSDLYLPDDFDNTSSVKNAFINSFSAILSCKPVELPGIIVPTIFNDFDDMQSHLFSTDERLNISVSSSLSYYQSCPQFLLNDDANTDLSLSFDEIPKDSLAPLDNYKEKDNPTNVPSNLNTNIPLSLSGISDKYTRSLSQFQVKPAPKEQRTHIQFDFNLNEVKDRINHSPLLNFKHYIKRESSPKIESDIPLTFQGISDQNQNAFANFQARDYRKPSDQVGHIYHNFNDFENSVIKSHEPKNIDRDLVYQIDNDYNLFGNLRGFTYVKVPNTGKSDSYLIDIVFIDEIIPLRQYISSMSSIENFERIPTLNKQQDEANKIVDSKSIGDIVPIDNSSINDMNNGVKAIYDIKKKTIPDSEDDITIDIELDFGEQIPSLRSNLEKVNSYEISNPKNQNIKDIDKILALKKSSFPVIPFDPNLALLTDKLINYNPVEQQSELSILVDEKDLLLAPDYKYIQKQPELVIERMNNTGPTMKLLLNTSFGEEYEKEIQIEEEEEEINDIFEEEEEEAIDIDSIDFSCLNPLYLDIPPDILSSINKSANSLDSSYLLQHGTNEGISDDYIDSSLKASRLLEKSRYVPYLFHVPSKLIQPLYHCQIIKTKSSEINDELMIKRVIKSTISPMSKVRYTPAFLNMYSPLIDNIIRLSHFDYNIQNNDEINFGIRPKVIHTSNFLSNVSNSATPINFYRRDMHSVKQPEFFIEAKCLLPKVRYTPHIFTYASSILSFLDSFYCKKKKIQSIKPRILNVTNENMNSNIISKSSNVTTKKKVCRKIKTRTNDDININEVKLKKNRIVKKSSSKKTVKQTTEKIVFSPVTKSLEFDPDLDDAELDLPKSSDNVITSNSTNNTLHKTKSSSKKTKKRAASARFKRQKLPDGTTMTIRKIVIEADSTYDDENEVNQSNVNNVPNNDEKIVFKSRKKKRRGCSVNHEKNSPKKNNQK